MPRAPVDGFDLAAFARVSVALSSRREPRAAVLAREGLTEQRWLAIESTWLLRMAASLLRQDLSLLHEHDEAVAAAQAAYAADR